MSVRPFEKQNAERVREVCNVLLESPFFYRSDEPDLFAYLRRHQAEFKDFFETYFGFGLFVDRKCARLLKERTVNPKLPPRARDVFDLSRRDECAVFLMMLEFTEEEMQRQNISYESDSNLCFLLATFVAHIFRRFRELLGDGAPDEERLFHVIGQVMRKLERHRLVRVKETGAAAEWEQLPAGLERHVLYEALPGLHAYSPSGLWDAIRRAYGQDEAVAGEGAAAGEAGDAGDAAVPAGSDGEEDEE